MVSETTRRACESTVRGVEMIAVCMNCNCASAMNLYFMKHNNASGTKNILHLSMKPSYYRFFKKLKNRSASALVL